MRDDPLELHSTTSKVKFISERNASGAQYQQDSMNWKNKGLAFAKRRKYKKAIECYDKALGIDPNNITAIENRKNAYLYHIRLMDEKRSIFSRVSKRG